MKLIGIGEPLEDLRPFDPDDFAACLVAEAIIRVMDTWIVWLVVACVLGVGEMHQGGFYLAPFAAGRRLRPS